MVDHHFFRKFCISFKNGIREFFMLYNGTSNSPGPIQIHHGINDWMVPLEWSEGFVREMEDANMPVELFTYEGDDHNISNNYREAMLRTEAFFDEYVKGE